MVNLALIGIGGYGWQLLRHVRKISEQVGCRLVAAADNRLEEFSERAKELTDEGVEIFDDAAVMYRRMQGRCDAVYVTTGIHSHAPLTIAAMEAGYHVHLEKPPAATVQEVDAMRRTAAATGKICLVGFQMIHSDSVRMVKDRIVSGRLGKLKRLICHACWPRPQAYYDRNEWAGKLRIGDKWVLDGPAMNALAHQTNNLLFLASAQADRFATPTAVRAELYAAGPVESHNVAAIETQTDQGATTYFIASHATQDETGVPIIVEGENGTATLDALERSARIVYSDGTEETFAAQTDPRSNMVANFIEAIKSDDASMIRCDLDDTRNAILALDGAHESSGKIHRIEGDAVRRDDDGTDKARTVVEGLNEAIASAAEKGCLFSDLDPAPEWAVATHPYDLSGYDEFPRRFRCD